MSKVYDALVKAEKIYDALVKTKERDEAVTPLSLSWRDIGLEWKIIGAIAGVVLFFALLFLAIVNQLMGRALRNQIDQRASIIATNLSDAAAGHVVGKNALELHALVTKYARLQGTAYAFIEDGKGQVLAHSLGTFPPELRETLTRDERKQVNRRVVRLRGKTVYETRTPILEGQVGAVHIGTWGDGVEAEIHNALLPIVALISIVLLGVVALSAFLARRIIQAIRQPTDTAGKSKISAGDLQTPVENRVTG
jgi:two-component system, cell cycle sensor histidine kinase and response regulator CckA